MSAAKILAVADLHLGRNPTRCANDATPSLTTAAAWERIVDFAVSEEVDAVAMAGDVVNSSHAFFSSLGILEGGLKRLESAGIPTFAVAGNHDVHLLRRLATVLDSDAFVILGRDGSWESRPFTSKSGVAIDFWGKSFTSERASASPMTAFPRPAIRSGVASLGILHCDLGGAGNYAPVREAELLNSGIPVWVLGHIHAPTQLPDGPVKELAFYCGSPLPLDPTETGVHGPCMITVNGAGVVESVTRVPLSPLRYETLTVDLSGITDLDGAQAAIAKDVRELADLASADAKDLTHLALRLRLVGRSPLKDADVLKSVNTNLVHGDAARELHAAVEIYVEKCSALLAPPIELSDYAGQSTPLGVVADLLAELEDAAGSPELEEILAGLTETVVRANDRQCNGIKPEGLPDAATLRVIAREQVMKIAHAMHDQMDSRS